MTDTYKNGFAISVHHLPDLTAALRKGEDKARELGLIEEEGAP